MKKKWLAVLVTMLLAMRAFADKKSDALFEAVESNDAAEVAILIKFGADVNAKDSDGWTRSHLRHRTTREMWRNCL